MLWQLNSVEEFSCFCEVIYSEVFLKKCNDGASADLQPLCFLLLEEKPCIGRIPAPSLDWR